MRDRHRISKNGPEIGKTVRLPDIKRHLDEAHAGTGWGPYNVHEAQAEPSFSFDGKAFRHYERAVLGKSHAIRRIYFPAVYTGAVARSLADAGYEVLAGDLSEYWAEHARGLGLRGERRSFEQIPDERLDAMVTFEPFCVPSPLVYVAILRAMSRGMPYIEIGGRFEEDGMFRLMFDMRKKAKPDACALPGKDYQEFLAMLKKKKLVRIADDSHEWEALEYGAQTMAHVVRSGITSFVFASVVPDESAGKKASLDLAVISEMEGWGRRISIPIGELAAQIGRTTEEVAGALGRLQRMATRFSEGGDAYAREFTVTE